MRVEGSETRSQFSSLNSHLASLLACPHDGGAPLRREPAQTGRAEAFLLCPICARRYPVDSGIPRLLPDPDSLPLEEAREKAQEREQRDAEAAVYDRLAALRLLSLAELPVTLRRLAPEARHTVVEVGSGTGRFTAPLAARAGHVVALDHSFQSLLVARRKLPPRSDVLLVQADASYLPLRSGAVDRVLSCQMLEHLPTDESRKRAVMEMARVLRPEGRLVVSAYYHSPATRMLGQKQGHHSGRIFFRRFTPAEFRALLAPEFAVEWLSAALGYILLAQCRPASAAPPSPSTP
jgi:ubiquinone/menaquinone biosynthesis C-methylase UbiE